MAELLALGENVKTILTRVTPTATGILAASTVLEVTFDVVNGYRVLIKQPASRIGTTGPIFYGSLLSMGTKPYTPPLPPFVDWVAAKLGIYGIEGVAVAKKIIHRGIKLHGIKANPYREQAITLSEPIIQETASRLGMTLVALASPSLTTTIAQYS